MKWPPTLCWTAPKTINGNRHFQVKAYGGKNEDRWVLARFRMNGILNLATPQLEIIKGKIRKY